ncbi:unnamed protein product, partial [Protopolystoma xenopodis]
MGMTEARDEADRHLAASDRLTGMLEKHRRLYDDILKLARLLDSELSAPDLLAPESSGASPGPDSNSSCTGRLMMMNNNAKKKAGARRARPAPARQKDKGEAGGAAAPFASPISAVDCQGATKILFARTDGLTARLMASPSGGVARTRETEVQAQLGWPQFSTGLANGRDRLRVNIDFRLLPEPSTSESCDDEEPALGRLVSPASPRTPRSLLGCPAPPGSPASLVSPSTPEATFRPDKGFQAQLGPAYPDGRNLFIWSLSGFTAVCQLSLHPWSEAFHLGSPGYCLQAKVELTTDHLGLF